MELAYFEKINLGLLNDGIFSTALDQYESISDITTLLEEERFNYDFFLSMIKHATSENAGILDRALSLLENIEAQRDNVATRIQHLKRQLVDLYFSLRNAQAVDKYAASYLYQLALDLSSDDLFDSDNTSTYLTDGKIIGINTSLSSSASYDDSLDKFTSSDVTVNLVDSLGVYSGFISANNINTGNKFSFQAKTSNLIKSRRFEIVIDRVNQTEINQIDLSMTESHLIEIYSSTDNSTFTKLYDDKVYIKTGIIPFSATTDQYIKIVIYKNSSLKTVTSKDGYTYKVDFNYLYISQLSPNKECEFITTAISPDIDSISSVSIDTCDNYNNKNVEISYFIDINGAEQWEEIRPIGKLGQNKTHVKTAIKTNNYFTNKVISLSKDIASYVSDADLFEYDLELDSDFLDSNQILIMRDILDTSVISWKLIDEEYTAYCVVNIPFTLTIADSEYIYINNVKYSGQDVYISQGLYYIRIPQAYYYYIFNPYSFDIISISDDGIYQLEDKTTKVITSVQDPNYPSNSKLNFELNSNFIFKNKSIENTSYYIYNSDTTYKIRTPKKENLYILYRLFEEDASGLSLRIKGIYSSLDNSTIPYTDRIILRFT